MKKPKLPKITKRNTGKPSKAGKLRSRLPRIPLPGKSNEPDTKLIEALQNLPRITNETVAEHREEVLGSARKYIYPLSHSKRRIVLITTTLFITVFIGFILFCLAGLYRFQSHSTFMYGVTQVVPFPVAKAGSSWVSYESYLFELRHTLHYYETQQHQNFDDKSGKRALAQLKQQALQKVIDNAYVKQLAKQNKITVSNAEVDQQVEILRSQNRLGSNDKVFRDVLNEFWGWTPNDFRRELRQQLLAQKVAAKLDTNAQARAQNALTQLKSGTDFATLAKQISDNQGTKANGGDYGFAIDRSNRDIPPQVTAALFALQKPGDITGIITTNTALEIDKLNDKTGNKVRASQIVFGLKPVTAFIEPLRAEHKQRTFITIAQPN